MNYLSLLEVSAREAGNCACVGLDVVSSLLPEGVSCFSFLQQFLTTMKEKTLIPAAFKPNIAYYAALNKAYEGDFSGYVDLAKTLKLIRKLFPNVPIILDAKRGDIDTSSAKYGSEAFDSWQVDAVTVSGYMGHDSVLPFRKGFEERGIYVLNRTSNPGASDVQNLCVKTSTGEEPLYKTVARQIQGYAKSYPGTGAVVGATCLDELKEIATSYVSNEAVPLLIPGVGSQGAKAPDVINVLKSVNYPLYLVRINSSSGLTSPWKKDGKAPANWLEVCMEKVASFLAETRI